MAEINPFRYRGYYYDTETGFYYLQTRYYDPEAMRFINPTDLSVLASLGLDGLNLYGYGKNSPIRITYSSSSFSGLDLFGGFFSIGNYFGNSNSFNISNLNLSQINAKNLIKDVSIGLGEVMSRTVWGLSKYGSDFLDFHYSAYGINGCTALTMLPSTSARIFKGVGIALMIIDVFEAGYYSYQNGHSFAQGAVNFCLTAGKNALVYGASQSVTISLGAWAGAKLGASLGGAAGPVGLFFGALVGAGVGWLIDEFGDVIIDWIVGMV